MEEVYGGQTQPPYLDIVYLLRYIHCKCFHGDIYIRNDTVVQNDMHLQHRIAANQKASSKTDGFCHEVDGIFEEAEGFI